MSSWLKIGAVFVLAIVLGGLWLLREVGRAFGAIDELQEKWYE